jgi:pimeloyl-ACP methyl ester carboxylesterase
VLTPLSRGNSGNFAIDFELDITCVTAFWWHRCIFLSGCLSRSPGQHLANLQWMLLRASNQYESHLLLGFFVAPRVRTSAHPTHQRAPGLRLEQTPKSNFWTPLGPHAPYCMLGPPPFLIILPCPLFLVYYTFDSDSPVSHPIGHAFPYHYNAALTTIANATHFSISLRALLLPIRDK